MIRWRTAPTAAPLLLAMALASGPGLQARPLAPPATGDQPAGRQVPAGALIAMASAQGQALLLDRATLRADYGSLSQWFETQANQAYCGVASSVMVLNSLALPAPAATGYSPYHFWTQTNLFAAAAGLRFARPEQVARQGMDLEQLQGLLAAQGLRSERYHGSDLSLEQLRLLLRRSLADPRDRLLVNYLRRSLGQAGGGHISPLAAYEPRSDRVLLLDVARYRYPAVWVRSLDLWQAIRTIDASSGRSRGLIRVMPPATPAEAPPPAETPPPPAPS